jgi:hypothetical protein
MDAKVTRQRQHALAFDFIAEDRNSGEIIANRPLPAGEDCSRRDAELLSAGFALPRPARRDPVDVHSTAFRAERDAAVIRESDLDEFRVRFLIGQSA